MTTEDFTQTLFIHGTPDQVFDAIRNVHLWWSGEIEGEAARVGDEFVYRYPGMHRSTQRVTALVRGERIVWHVLDAELTFVDDTGEWRGTDIVFELRGHGTGTELRFTHVGLHARRQCHASCAAGWTTLLGGNLRNLVATGLRQPDAFATVT